MNENENLVTEVTENAEQTAEETRQPKTYTEDEVNDIVGKKKSIIERKLRKEYDRKYSEYEEIGEILKAGMGKENLGEIKNGLNKFYAENVKGYNPKIKKNPEYSAKDIEALAKADADELISYGDDEVAEELDRLTELGVANMSARDKARFEILESHMRNAKTSRELSSIGVTEDVYNSEEFKEFRKMFNPDTPITKVYETYAKTQSKKEIRTMGSMKTTESKDNGIKDYYSPNEARMFTRKQLDENPALFKAICNSMSKWKK
jgi:hypothetical protein